MTAMVRIFSLGKRWNLLFHEAIAELDGTFHLSPNENILTIARIETVIICFISYQNNWFRSKVSSCIMSNSAAIL